MSKIRNIEEKKLMVAYCIMSRHGKKQELTNKLIRDVWKSVAAEDLCVGGYRLIVNSQGELWIKHKQGRKISQKAISEFWEKKRIFDEIFIDVRAYANNYSKDEIRRMLQEIRDNNHNKLYELAAPMRLEVMQFIHGNDYKNFSRTARYHVVRHCEDDHGKIDLYISGDYEEVRDKLLKEQMRVKKRK